MFTSHLVLYWFLRMPFGLKEAPARFWRVVDVILVNLICKTTFIYLDNIASFCKPVMDHMAHVEEVLSLSDAYRSAPNWKCAIFFKWFNCLKVIIRPVCRRIGKSTIKAVQKLFDPRSNPRYDHTAGCATSCTVSCHISLRLRHLSIVN